MPSFCQCDGERRKRQPAEVQLEKVHNNIKETNRFTSRSTSLGTNYYVKAIGALRMLYVEIVVRLPCQMFKRTENTTV